MSTIRDPATITKVGRQMMTAGGDITYTKATLYGQDISHLTKDQLESLTSIGNPLMTVPVGISDKSVNGSATTIVLEATFQNSNLKADLPYTAVGFFAKKDDGDEKLVLVGVANPGTYLVATSPDGIATDALDIKVAIAIGDATSVTAVVDPAGSVTPATLNGAINKLDHDISAKIDAKADKTTVEGDLATKANQSDLDQTNAEVAKKADSEDVTSQLATKANSSDVAASVKSLTDSIATKADAKTVNDAISKIDFTPYAKTADVDSKLQGYTNTADLTKLLDVKANAVDVYSKTELDKKLLALSTDTDGKVNVDQVSSMIADKADKADVTAELAKKDDTSDVDAKIKTVTDLANTKANSVDVTAALDKKDDTSDVDAKIKTVTDLANTKANANDVYNRSTVDNAFTEVRGRLSKLEGTQTLDSPDFNGITASGVYYITNNNGANIKNNPVDQWGVLIVSNGDGHRVSQVYYPDDGNPPWYRSLDESTWRSWYQLSTRNDVNNATNSANAASNKVDTVLTNSYVRKQGMNQNGDLVEIKNTGIKQDNGGYAFDMWSDDWTASKLKDVLNALPGKASTTDVANANNNANGRLPLGGGNMTLRSTINWNGGGIDDKTGNLGGLQWAGGTDTVSIYGDQNNYDNLDLAFDLGDDSSNHFSFRNNGSEVAAIYSNGHFSGTVDWSNVSGRPDVNVAVPLFRRITAGNTWNDILGASNGDTPVLVSIRDEGGANTLGNYSAAVAFGGGDTKGVLNVAYSDHTARIIGGNGNAPVWHEDIAWKSDIDRLQNIINQQNQTIQSLTSRLNNAENEINYIKANYVEGRTFPASQEAQANSWENENPQRIAFITK